MAASVPTSVAGKRTPYDSDGAAAIRGVGSRAAICLALDAGLLIAGLAAAVGIRVAFGPLQWSDFSASQYAVCAGVCLVLLVYEGVYGGGIQALDQTERIVKALTGGLLATILYTFATQRSAEISRFVLVASYAADLLIFVLVRPILVRWLGLWPHLRLIPADAAAEKLTGLLGGRSEAGEADGPPIVVAALEPGGHTPERLAEWERRYGNVAMVAVGTDPSIAGAVPVNLHGGQVYVISHPLALRFNRALKRAFDCVGAALALILAAPLMVLVWCAVRLDSPGPALFRHRRLGRGGEPFEVLKFRTMCGGSDERLQELLAADPKLAQEFRSSFKIKRDPRVTRVGRILRRTSLDELPQLWNVLRGDMSLVGPRPVVATESALYGAAYPLVATVRPGVTGLWQTSGRSATAYESRAQFDVFYVRRWSLSLDLAVIVRTIQAMVLPADY